MRNPFRYFKTSPEIIRLAVMMYVRFPLPDPAGQVTARCQTDPAGCFEGPLGVESGLLSVPVRYCQKNPLLANSRR